MLRELLHYLCSYCSAKEVKKRKLNISQLNEPEPQKPERYGNYVIVVTESFSFNVEYHSRNISEL